MFGLTEVVQRGQRAAKRESGFTLMEALVTVALISIVTATGAVYLPELKNSYNRKNTRDLLQADIRRAKNEAARVGARGLIVFASGGRSYSYGLDYPPYSTATPPVADENLGQRTLPLGFTITSGSALYFNSRGILVSSSGAVTTSAVSLTDPQGTFFTGTVYATGALY